MSDPTGFVAEASLRLKVVAVGLLVLAAVVLALVWIGFGLDPVWLAVTALAVHAIWLHRDRFTVHGHTDEARADASEAVGRIEAVENHLTGLEPPSSGKHAKTRTPTGAS